MTSWARVEDDLEFAEPGKYSSQAGQAKVSEGREDWSLLLELNHWNVMMRPERDNRLGNVLRTHAHHLVGARWCRSASMPQPVPCRQLQIQNVLPRQTAAVAGQKRAERSLMGTWNLHASSHRPGYTCTFLPRPTAEENGVLKFPDLREEDNTKYVVFDSGAECAHT